MILATLSKTLIIEQKLRIFAVVMY